ncbi:hypothetical protein [Actinospica robiniae]|uniref:hypothetical protein n=1 Tax=Actinospica robiniae TaxID=304901 RepID=UPI0004200B79|nr:hypothetical protein [Actinospica robiniae]
MPIAQRTGTVRALARFFPGASELAREPVLREYLADAARPYGVAVCEDELAAGRGHSYGEMGQGLLEEVVGEGEEVGVLILAHAVPDVRPGRSTALYLSSVCPGRPHAFAVTEQGVSAAYTAIRLAATFLGSGESRNALILIVEQAAQFYEMRTPVSMPKQHAGVALWLEPGDATVYQHTCVTRAEALRLLPEAPLLLLGDGLAEVAGEQPMTGAWAAYAEQPGPAVIADYDPDIQTLSICVLGTPA